MPMDRAVSLSIGLPVVNIMKLVYIFSYSITQALLISCGAQAPQYASGPVVDGKQSTKSYQVLADYLREVPGVQVNNFGGEFKVVIRGMGSENGMEEPLYVIDGRRFLSYAAADGSVDPNEIRRVTVLKDAASTLSYGMQGANGVIVIYLKK